MPQFLFQPFSIDTLASAIVFGAIFVHLLTTQKKSRATWWLIVLFFVFTAYTLNAFIFNSLPVASNSQVTYSILYIFGVLITWSFLHFTYCFLENPYKKEAKIALWVTSPLLLFFISYMLVSRSDANYISINSVILLLALWATIVLARKWNRARRDTSVNSPQRTPRVYRAFLFLNLLWVLSYILVLLFSTGVVADTGWVYTLSDFAFYGFMFGLPILYINYSPEPTSFQVKLIGLSLVALLALMAVVSRALYPKDIVEHAMVVPPAHEALRFIPDDSGRYGINNQYIAYDSTALTEDLHSGDEGDTLIAIGFSFPFSGGQWDSLYVSPNGVVTFGNPLYGTEPVGAYDTYIFNGFPKIVPLYSDYDPSSGGHVYFSQADDRVVISWHKVPLFLQNDQKSSFQLVLHKNGVIDFVYDKIDSLVNIVARGLIPAGSSPQQYDEINATKTIPVSLASGTAWVQNFYLMYRLRAHEEIKKLIWLILGTTLFVLIVFPFFFRTTLINPLDRLLDGVRKVDKGDLDTEVSVGSRDEIGFLTMHFNSMTHSLRNYRDKMEDLVSERTAKLEKSLADLRSAQAQLVQQEKLASLGQLTAGIAHEIKNPLNFVNNFSELSVEMVDEIRQEVDSIKANSNGSLPSEALNGISELLDDIDTNLRKIHEHGSRADSIVKSMLEHSRGGSGVKSPTDLNALMKEFVNLCFHGMRAGKNPINVDLQFDLDETIKEVPLIAEDFSRIIVNVCNNAFDAMREKQTADTGGTYKPVLTVRTYQQDGGITVEIEDNGPGIPDDIKSKIMQPFFTTKKGTEGTGLGLSITNDIIKAHGGTLQIETKEQQFTRFRVYLT